MLPSRLSESEPLMFTGWNAVSAGETPSHSVPYRTISDFGELNSVILLNSCNSIQLGAFHAQG
jgi:hypothetical protein